MCIIPKSDRKTKIEYTDRECGFYDVPNKIGIARNEKNRMIQEISVSLPGYAFDLTPVTNADFYKFISATNYLPADTQNFLKHWIDNKPPKGKEQHPVVYVNIDDARAYARWAGRRLPTEEEWQYAAEGPHQYKYPWGNEFKNEYCNSGQPGGTTAVRQFEKGKSFFGCYDMCGNVWEWTESERTDGLTRFCIIKGGSYYKVKGSVWYADGEAQPTYFSAKFILISPGLDRCATIGFRCAADVKD
jgi:iron(II)-dependent oxidoreductase